ncbi:hypothetical protein ACWXVT_02240 [Mycoplasma sp. 1573]
MNCFIAIKLSNYGKFFLKDFYKVLEDTFNAIPIKSNSEDNNENLQNYQLSNIKKIAFISFKLDKNLTLNEIDTIGNLLTKEYDYLINHKYKYLLDYIEDFEVRLSQMKYTVERENIE